uniref:Uncharacterized protein DDB_G0287625-like n=1 Tax=Dermatophagoides pteronyssinus TaxID=6956 RepID=A0A6P6XTF3_DERPT|nr:uncharacterized protein DDB_G0287625-like [Dermatophagoides pteronyssinus]
MMDGTNVKRVFLSHHQQQQKLPTIWTSKIWPYWQQNFQSSSTTKNIDNIIIDDKNVNHHHDEQTAGVIKLIGSFLIGILFLSLVAIAVFIRVETNKSSTIMIMDTAASSSSSSKTTTTMTSNRNKNSMIENNSKIKNNNNKNERNHQNVNNNGAIILASLLSSSPSRLSSSSPSNVEPNPTTLQMVNSLLMEDVDSFNNNKINNSKKREIQPPTTIETIEKRKINETNPILYSEAKYLPSSTINLAEQKNPNEMINNNNKSTTLQSIVIPTQRIIIEMDIKVTKPIITQNNNNNNDDSDNVNDDDNNNSSS